jgi:hypothetical protein
MVIHIVVNLVCFLFRRFILLLGENPDTKPEIFVGLTSKESDSKARRALAYVLTAGTLASIAIVTVSTLFEQPVFVSELANVAELVISPILDKNGHYGNSSAIAIAPSITETVVSYRLDGSTDFSEPGDTARDNIASAGSDKNSIVDYLKDSAIFPSSFEERGILAERLGVVGSVSEYTGSQMQNVEILSALHAVFRADQLEVETNLTE